jgi:integrase
VPLAERPARCVGEVDRERNEVVALAVSSGDVGHESEVVHAAHHAATRSPAPGLRVTEFCELADDAIVKMNETNWLRVPVGKLRTDRYVPLHPSLIELHRTWLNWNGPNLTGRLISNKGRPLTRDVVTRIVKRCARIAGIGHVHPHQLRHTLATQSINNGMSLEAVSVMLGHRSMPSSTPASQTAPSRMNTSPPPTKSTSSTPAT